MRSKSAPALLSGTSLAAYLVLGACLDRPLGNVDPVTTNVYTARISRAGVDRIDLLFMIDNSSSMSDKQLILETAVPDLVDRLVNPICVDTDGGQHPAAPPGEPCPADQHREFLPVTDINVAVISSSLGDAGANNACLGGDTVDGGRLLGSLSRAAGVSTNPSGFITWREDTDPRLFKRDFQALVRAVGESGCGWEASLEAWYRFLIDPVPYAAYDKVPCSPGARAMCTTPRLGSDNQPLLDETLLAQRAAFLRPDSLVAIIMLTDENDCSLRATGQSWIAGTFGSGVAPMYAASSACAADPNSACCYACPSGPPAGCEWADAPCQASTEHLEDRLPPLLDATNLRCFEQKRRFGVDFLYPTERYVNALSRPRLCPSNPTLDSDDCPGGSVDNPLFAGGRAAKSVYLAGIVGVPWQAIAANTDEEGSALPEDVLRFKTAAEFGRADWDRILGDPGASPPRLPSEPLMRESTLPRADVVTGGPNGREYATDASLAGLAEDLQYACIFPLSQPRECKDETPQTCDCTPTLNDQPLCEASPGVTAPTTVQHWAKAYPGLRELEVLQGYGDNSIVASICARNVRDQSRRDFGYRPAIASIVERLEEQLVRRCLPRPLEVKTDGSVPCRLVEVQPNAEACFCDPSLARTKPTRLVEESVRQQLASGEEKPCGADDPQCQRACLCEVQQIVTEPALSACRNEDNPTSAEGWCYVADSDDQHIGKPSLVDECPSTERRVLRFVGQGIRKGALTVISCLGRSFAEEP